jgi:hypothetical protein
VILVQAVLVFITVMGLLTQLAAITFIGACLILGV